MLKTLISIMLLAVAVPGLAADADLRQRAATALADGNMKQAARLYRRLVRADDDDGEAHYRLGMAQMALDDLRRAEQHFVRARDLGYQPQAADLRLARIYARLGDNERVIARLSAIGAAGFGAIQLVDGNADFAALSGQPGYEAAVEAIRGNRYPCNGDARHRAFDFWIGEWDVYNAGQLAGQNSIQPILGHCTLFEQWTSASGAEGKSFNYYDPGTDHWRQIWISDSGSFIEFSGEARGGGIFYTATTVNPGDGAETLHRFNFTQNDDGSVRQHWMQSTDAGANWNTVWDGRYVRKSAD